MAMVCPNIIGSCCSLRPPAPPGPVGSCLALLCEAVVAERLHGYAARTVANRPELCELDPAAFAEQVIKGKVAIDDGDWVQPLFRRAGGVWKLCKLEVLFRVNDAMRVPFPSFVNFVSAASDQSPDPNPDLRESFANLAVDSLRRVDARLSQLGGDKIAAMADAELLTAVNVTAKQLRTVLSVPLKNSQLIALEETEYDDEPDSLTELRCEAWQKMGAFSLDDVKPTIAEIEVDGIAYVAPVTPSGQKYKALPAKYNHDLASARRFISDFRRARCECSTARAELKLDEEFCCHLVGVGHAPFSRTSMDMWRQAHPELSARIREVGVQLLREALDAGMGICLEVSFEDADVQWLFEALPELESRLFKQGGRSGSAALPHSLAHWLLEDQTVCYDC